MNRRTRSRALFVGLVMCVTCASAGAQDTLVLTDYLAMPITGHAEMDGNPGSLARINVMREEPGGTGRWFVNDLNGPLYIIDKKTKTPATYLNFNGIAPQTGLFHRMFIEAGSPTVSSASSSIPTTPGMGSSTRFTSRIRRWRGRRCRMGRACRG